jgi:periplasmic divalent cation tolerance protein
MSGDRPGSSNGMKPAPSPVSVVGLSTRSDAVSTEFVQVSTATESRASATALARTAVEAHLAAGAQIVGPVASIVWHLGELVEGEEWQVLLRTRADLYGPLEAHLLKHHPWKNPEVAAVPLTGASPAYLDWLRRMTEAA